MRAFLCHSSQHSDFVVAVAQYLRKSLDGDVFFYEEHQVPDEEHRDSHTTFLDRINKELDQCGIMVVFASAELTKWQKREVNFAVTHDRRLIPCLLGTHKPPSDLNLSAGALRIEVPEPALSQAYRTAVQITSVLGITFANDGLPVNPHIFSYEKDIIEHFADCLEYQGRSLPEDINRMGASERKHLLDKLEKLRERQLDGCPLEWPEVARWTREAQQGADSRSNQERPEVERLVLAAALSKYHQPECGSDEVKGCMLHEGLCFPEAFKRDSLYFPRGKAGLRVGVVVSGGIAPGINAVIDGIVQRHQFYAGPSRARNPMQLEIVGLRNGFLAFDDLDHARTTLSVVESAKYATEGGSFLGTSRDDLLFNGETRQKRLVEIIEQLHFNRFDILYVIGGDGSMKAAHALWTKAEELRPKHDGRGISVVAVPKTMDNDILWVWQAFGFMSAVEKAREVIQHIGTEVQSNPRLYVVQLFGSDSGFVVSHAVVASKGGLCDVALIPEIEFSMPRLAEHMRKKMRDRQETLPRGLVVMAETAIPSDALHYVDREYGGLENTGEQEAIKQYVNLNAEEQRAIQRYWSLRDAGRRIEGQTDEHLRTAGLKIVSRGLTKLLQSTSPDDGDPEWSKLRVCTNEPRHLLRAIPPSCTDIIFGNRLGTLAVDNAMAGYTDFMISQWLTEYVLVPLQLVVLGRKRIPPGMFWQSVRTKTGQDDLKG